MGIRNVADWPMNSSNVENHSTCCLFFLFIKIHAFSFYTTLFEFCCQVNQFISHTL